MAKNPFPKGDLTPHADAFMKAEQNLKLDAVGNGGYDLHADHLIPTGTRSRSGRVQTPAQHASVKKAAAVSVAHRRLRSGGGGL